jgi:carbonic anhydrase
MELSKSKISEVLNKTTQASLKPIDAIELLKEGNQRFLNQKPLNRDFISQTTQTAKCQFPHATVLSCIDSRIPTENIFDQGIGDVFNARIAGNFVNEDILGSLEFACRLAGSKLIVVMGHTSCGAVKGSCDKAELGVLTQMLSNINPAVDAIETSPDEKRDSSNENFAKKCGIDN